MTRDVAFDSLLHKKWLYFWSCMDPWT